MSHRVAPLVTAGPSPEHHVGVNTVFSTYTFGETGSGSQTIAMARIPPGARITYAALSWNNNDLSTTTGALIALQSMTGSNINGNIIASAAVSTNPQYYSPDYAMIGYRHSASSNAVIRMGASFVLTGTATTIFSLELQYICDLDGD